MDIYILHLETATKSCSVALSLNGALKQNKETTEEGYSHGENLTLFIEEIMLKEGIEMKQLSAVCVSSGPGSYTGLRIGVSTAKGICYALGIPLLAIDSLRCLQQTASQKYPDQKIASMIDARRMEVFSAIYDQNGVVLKPVSADIIDEHTYEEFIPFIACGDGADKLSTCWQNRNITIDNSIFSSAAAQPEMAYQKFLQNDFEDVAYFEPFYLKDFVMQVKNK